MMAALDNSRPGKARFRYYDGHDAPRTLARDRSVRWRLWRRESKRWLKRLVQIARDGELLP